MPGVVQLVRWGAAVGRDIPLRAYTGDDPLRDIGQLRLLARLRVLIGDRWSWRPEVPVSTRHNRAALAGAMTIRPALPCGAREALAALRAGDLPRANAIIVV